MGTLRGLEAHWMVEVVRPEMRWGEGKAVLFQI